MKIIESYLQERIQGDPYGKTNAPTFAFICLYGKNPSPAISGRESSHPQKLYNGIGIDKNIPTKVLNDLNGINGIELRSSCEGDSDRHPTFVIFRTLNRKPEYTKSVIKKLNNYEDIKACWDMGNEGLPRIIVTTKLWYKKNPKEFNNWWMNLPKRIKTSL